MVFWNGTPYYYVTNLQGDVIAILDTDGNIVVQYTYDAWGNILTTTGTLANTLGTLNPEPGLLAEEANYHYARYEWLFG